MLDVTRTVRVMRKLCHFLNVSCLVRILARPRVKVSQVQFVPRPQLSQLCRDMTPLVTKCAFKGVNGNRLLKIIYKL